MKTRMTILSIILSMMIVSQAIAQPNPNIRLYGYLTTWALDMTGIPGGAGAANYGNCPYTAIDFDACTDYITFDAHFTSTGTMQTQAEWDGGITWGPNATMIQMRRPLNDYIHSKGKSVQMTMFVDGSGGNFTTLLSTSTGRNAMVKTIVDSLIGPKNQYDGVHFDIEPMGAADTANGRIFFKQLRDTLDKYHQWIDVTKKPMITVTTYNSEHYWGTVYQYFDAILDMSYNMFGSWESISWFNAPVFDTGYESGSYNIASISSKMNTYLSAGVPRNKLVMGCPLNYNAFQGGSSGGGEGIYAPMLPMTTFPTWMMVNTSGNVVNGSAGSEMYYLAWNKWIDTATTTIHHDNIMSAGWIGYNNAGSANDWLILFQDTISIRQNLEYVSAQGLQGGMVWEINGAYLSTRNVPSLSRHPGLARDFLLQAVKRTRLALAGSIAGTLTATPQTLPSAGGTVTLSWTSQSATSASIDHGIGTVSLNSSKTINVTSAETFCLTLSNGTASITYSTAVKLETPLPVQLTSFIGVVTGHYVDLAWKTATEVNSTTFEIERRAIAQWEKIGELPAAGTSNTPHEYTYVDNLKNIGPGNILYRLKTINNDGSFQYSAEVEVASLPITFSLQQNYPNPFNPQTKIQYSLPENAFVQLKVYDITGREVSILANENQVAGYYEKTFNSMNLSSGVYFYRVTAQTQGKNTLIQMKKMVLLK